MFGEGFSESRSENAVQPLAKYKSTVSFRNFIVFFRAETLAH